MMQDVDQFRINLEIKSPFAVRRARRGSRRFAGFGVPFRPGCALAALDRTRSQSGHDLALGEHGEQQHRQSDEQRRGGERTPAQLIE